MRRYRRLLISLIGSVATGFLYVFVSGIFIGFGGVLLIAAIVLGASSIFAGKKIARALYIFPWLVGLYVGMFLYTAIADSIYHSGGLEGGFLFIFLLGLAFPVSLGTFFLGAYIGKSKSEFIDSIEQNFEG